MCSDNMYITACEQVPKIRLRRLTEATSGQGVYTSIMQGESN